MLFCLKWGDTVGLRAVELSMAASIEKDISEISCDMNPRRRLSSASFGSDAGYPAELLMTFRDTADQPQLDILQYKYQLHPPAGDAVVQLVRPSGCQAGARQAAVVVTLSSRTVGALFSNLTGEYPSSPPPSTSTFRCQFCEDTPLRLRVGGVRCSSTLRLASWPIG